MDLAEVLSLCSSAAYPARARLRDRGRGRGLDQDRGRGRGQDQNQDRGLDRFIVQDHIVGNVHPQNRQ